MKEKDTKNIAINVSAEDVKKMRKKYRKDFEASVKKHTAQGRPFKGRIF